MDQWKRNPQELPRFTRNAIDWKIMKYYLKTMSFEHDLWPSETHQQNHIHLILTTH